MSWLAIAEAIPAMEYTTSISSSRNAARGHSRRTPRLPSDSANSRNTALKKRDTTVGWPEYHTISVVMIQ